MRKEELARLLDAVRTQELPVEEALNRLETLPFEDLGFARVDHHRSLRTGLPEVVYCPGKTPEQVVGIFAALARRSRPVIATRASEELFRLVQESVPDTVYDSAARMVFLPDPGAGESGLVAVVSAGTADLPVAQEAALTARLMGAKVETLWDAGVAGMHRLVPSMELLRRARVIVVVAGMEGALPSVIAGLVARPVIGVPTSIGYGAALGGITALLGMLTSCAAGVSVVNIDNGFGAGYLAALVNRSIPSGE
ncbi:MAG: nickel pincer cofactor biosynthesis protein LarB [Candidatus Eisenbacteria bacterium]|jgi:hypothetical protein|nr:nickel pincer cofactor biosynthesis protein LarB [Candidatus Eisenbacteria bacterium]